MQSQAVVITTMSLADCQCENHARMRGRAGQLRERLGLLSPAEVFSRWAAGASEDEMERLERGVIIGKARTKALQAG